MQTPDSKRYAIVGRGKTGKPLVAEAPFKEDGEMKIHDAEDWYKRWMAHGGLRGEMFGGAHGSATGPFGWNVQ